jgi:LysR family transcriptional regulator, glycine cleavage system transcriptional activator
MPHNLPSLEALQAVLKAATTGSFSAAADALNVTHGAISRRAAMVERWAGITVFERHGRGVRLTLEGERLTAQIEHAISILQDGRLLQFRDADLDVVRVGVVQSFARLWLIPHLHRLEGVPPDLRVELEIDDTHMTLSDARIAIRLGRGDWPGVTATRLFTETLQPFAATEIARQLGANATPKDMLRYPLVHDASEANWNLWLSRAGIAYERRTQDRTLPGYDLTLLAAARGHGVVLARDPYGKDDRLRLGLQPVCQVVIENSQSFHLVTKIGRRHSTVERLAERILAVSSGKTDR